jgi:hypothetical protein
MTSVSEAAFSTRDASTIVPPSSFSYMRHQAIGVKKSKTKIVFKRILDDVFDKNKWQDKWKKIK